MSFDKGRGYEVSQNQFLMVAEEELEAAQQESRTRPYSAVPSRSAGPLDVEIECSSPIIFVELGTLFHRAFAAAIAG